MTRMFQVELYWPMSVADNSWGLVVSNVDIWREGHAKVHTFVCDMHQKLAGNVVAKGQNTLQMSVVLLLRSNVLQQKMASAHFPLKIAARHISGTVTNGCWNSEEHMCHTPLRSLIKVCQ